MTETTTTEKVIDPAKEAAKAKRRRNQALAKAKLTRAMLTGSDDKYPEIDRDFVKRRVYSEVLNIFVSEGEAVEFVREAFGYERDKELIEKNKQLQLLLNDPELSKFRENHSQNASSGGAKSVKPSVKKAA